jgi:hypothetical protein
LRLDAIVAGDVGETPAGDDLREGCSTNADSRIRWRKQARL